MQTLGVRWKAVGPSGAWPVRRFFAVSLQSLLVSGVLLLVACQREQKPEQRRPAALDVPCPAGYSIDPPRSALEPGIRAFQAREYKRAQEVFAALALKYPASGTSLVWQGDAVLFDRDLEGRQAAELSLPLYEAAGKLHDAGCKLPRRPRYYHLMDSAYAVLRLALREDGYDQASIGDALVILNTAAAEFPTSAEVPYTQARAHCAEADLEKARGADFAQKLAACQHEFADSLRLAGQLQRPRFLRTHRSMQDWIVRSRTQSEFQLLRASSDYDRIVSEAMQASPVPLALSGGD